VTKVFSIAMVLLVLGAVSACSSLSSDQQQGLAEAQANFNRIKNDADVLRAAPKDVVRAGESLARAERLADYLGSAEDVQHYAYLSQRYAEIARQHSLAQLNQERLARLELERQRLQLTLREAKLLSVQEHNAWLAEQMAVLHGDEGARGLVMTLGDVLFEVGEAHLLPAASRTLLQVAHYLQMHPRRKVRIEGYTDNTGSADFNLQLSRDRAQSVADLLEDLGVASERVQVVGHGIDFPVAENASVRGRAQNRRVEIVFSDEQGRLSAER
jgi:outer membrane protein OmpA-like peptidoglycan-associated protein